MYSMHASSQADRRVSTRRNTASRHRLPHSSSNLGRLRLRNFRQWPQIICQMIRQGCSDSDPAVGEGEFDDLEGQQARIKPEAIDVLCRLTKFTRRELQLMYRGFKQDCPSGVVKEDTFKSIYQQFFPRGSDSSSYAHYVFNTFDTDRTGAITFTDFVLGLSVLVRGTVQEKLNWTFHLYDLNSRGFLTREEISRMVNAVYEMLGPTMGTQDEQKLHVERVFKKLDANNDGIITLDDFLDSCTQDENIISSLQVFNTIV